jgi:tRNA A37 threonylcarbamoyladenosine modification protein TsaB
VGEDGNLEAMTPEGVIPPHEIQLTRPEATIGAGNGFERYIELQQLGQGLLRVEAQLQASAPALIPLAQQWLKHNKALPAIGAQPQYVRNQVAEKSAK